MLSDNSFPAWKYLRAIAKFVVTNRVDRLKQNVARGLASLDPVCRWADECERVKGQGWGATVPPDAFMALAKENLEALSEKSSLWSDRHEPEGRGEQTHSTSIFKQRLVTPILQGNMGL